MQIKFCAARWEIRSVGNQTDADFVASPTTMDSLFAEVSAVFNFSSLAFEFGSHLLAIMH